MIARAGDDAYARVLLRRLGEEDHARFQSDPIRALFEIAQARGDLLTIAAARIGELTSRGDPSENGAPLTAAAGASMGCEDDPVGMLSFTDLEWGIGGGQGRTGAELAESGSALAVWVGRIVWIAGCFLLGWAVVRLASGLSVPWGG